MDIPRRLYLYAVTFISLEGLIWGLVGLGAALVRASPSAQAEPLALILVSLPVFLIHTWLIERGVRRHPGERSNRLRAVFLYGSLLAILVPLARHLLALLNWWLLDFFIPGSPLAAAGGRLQTQDHLITIAANALAAGFILAILRRDWRKLTQVEAFAEARQLYRHFWLIYGLVIAVVGAQAGLLQLISLLVGRAGWEAEALVAGLARLVFGLAVWAFAFSLIQRSLVAEAESEAPLPLAVLFLLAVTGAGYGLFYGGVILGKLLRAVFSLSGNLPDLLADLQEPLSIATPLALTGWFYARRLNATEASSPDAWRGKRLGRLYAYTLALFGLAGAQLGVALLISQLVDLVPSRAALSDRSLQETLANGLAALLVGIPVWLVHWLPANRQAGQTGDEGDQARRSQSRRAYLYLVLFLATGLSMALLVALLYQVLSAALSVPPERPGLETARLGGVLLSLLLNLAYHWRALIKDRRSLERSLARRHAQYPVLVLDTEEESLSQNIAAALERQAPELPVALHPVQSGAPDETLSVARAVILPAALLARPPEALRVWLQSFPGTRLVVPTAAPGWLWISTPERSPNFLAERTAELVRRLAEGEAVETTSTSGARQPSFAIPAARLVLQGLVLLLALIVAVLVSLQN